MIWHCIKCGWSGSVLGERQTDPDDPSDVYERCCPMCDNVDVSTEEQ